MWDCSPHWNGVAPREKLLNLIADTYSKPNEILGYNNLPDLDIKDGASFYQTMIQILLNDPSRNLSNEQKEYWSSMADKVDMLLQYGYYEGWEVIVSSFELLMFALLAVCIVIVPVLFIPMCLTPNGTTGAYNLTLFLLPYRSTMPEFNKYISCQFGGLVLDTLTVRAILYAFLAVIMLPLARSGFRKHQ